jgi:ribulose-phosphate 3-epimerase
VSGGLSPGRVGGGQAAVPKIAAVSWDEWIRGVEIEPSLYAADFTRLGEQIETLLDAGARVFHFDIGDGHFVEPVTIGPIVLQAIAPLIHGRGGVLDCHLMVDNPSPHIPQVARAGGDSVTFHYEVVSDVVAAAGEARELGLGVGLAFNPESDPAEVAAAADGVDLVLCMSIHPGYSGQRFMPETIGRLRTLRAALPAEVHVQVDGGVNLETAPAAREAGANLLVAATAIFGGEDIADAYRALAAEVT